MLVTLASAFMMRKLLAAIMGSSWYSLCCKIQLAAVPALSERHRDVVAIQILALVIIVGDNGQADFNSPPLIVQFVPTTIASLAI
jgi:hypothetical protein